MTKGLVRSMARAAPQRGSLRKLNIPMSIAIAVAGASGIGFGSSVIQGLPEGNILLLGAVMNVQFTHGADANAIAAFTGNFGVGSTPANDGTITAGDVDIIASTALAAATANVSPLVRAVNAAQSILDNTAGDLELNLNLLIDDASISGAAGFVAKGFLAIAYIVLGDD